MSEATFCGKWPWPRSDEDIATGEENAQVHRARGCCDGRPASSPVGGAVSTAASSAATDGEVAGGVDYGEGKASPVISTDQLNKVRAALTYISSPTMGLPPGRDAAEFAGSDATEQHVRLALQTCIRIARDTLPLLPSPKAAPSADAALAAAVGACQGDDPFAQEANANLARRAVVAAIPHLGDRDARVEFLSAYVERLRAQLRRKDKWIARLLGDLTELRGEAERLTYELHGERP